MPDLQARRELPDGGDSFRRQTLDRQQQLVLLRFDAVRPRRFLAVAQETPDVMTEFRQGTVTGRG